MKRAVLYLRVSTLDQTTANQECELREVAARAGWEVAKVYKDHGISGAKGRDKRPAFDALHKAAVRREFDVVMAWSVDRLGRSLKDLVNFLDELRALNVDLFLKTQGIDTTSPSGKAMFGMLSVFADFERSIIQERVRAGLARAKGEGNRHRNRRQGHAQDGQDAWSRRRHRSANRPSDAVRREVPFLSLTPMHRMSLSDIYRQCIAPLVL